MASAPPSGGLTWPDYAMLVLALGALVALGAAFSRGQKDTGDFLLARRRIPWWAASLSFLATEISAVTIISVPATAYSENWQYLQFFVGSSLAKFVVAWLFIPAFYRHDCTTIYEFLRYRFGTASQVTGSIFFFVTRLLGSGVRLMAAALAVSILVGWPLPADHRALHRRVHRLHRGGRRQGGGVDERAPGRRVPRRRARHRRLPRRVGRRRARPPSTRPPPRRGGSPRSTGARRRARPTSGARVLTDPNIFWLAVLNGLVGSMAAFGTDYDLMQRLLTVETRRESQRTLALTPIGTLVTLALYLSIGAGLFTYYAQHPGQALPRPDEIFPFFIRTAMPEILRGLMLVAIVLASIDSPLGSLAASFVTDIYRPLIARGRSERHYVRVSRVAVMGFGLALALLAWGFSFFDRSCGSRSRSPASPSARCSACSSWAS